MIQDTNMGDEVTPYKLRAADGTWKSALFGSASNGLVTEELDLDVSGAVAFHEVHLLNLLSIAFQHGVIDDNVRRLAAWPDGLVS